MANEWMNDPRVKSIDPRKLEVIELFVGQNQSKSPEQLIPEIVTLNTKLRSMNLEFTNQDSELILDILKESMTFEERKRVDLIKQIMSKRR